MSPKYKRVTEEEWEKAVKEKQLVEHLSIGYIVGFDLLVIGDGVGSISGDNKTFAIKRPNYCAKDNEPKYEFYINDNWGT